MTNTSGLDTVCLYIGGVEDLHTDKEKRRNFSALKLCTDCNCGLCDHFQRPF